MRIFLGSPSYYTRKYQRSSGFLQREGINYVKGLAYLLGFCWRLVAFCLQTLLDLTKTILQQLKEDKLAFGGDRRFLDAVVHY
ncbi:hypothetical protein AAZX31_04G144900 [Glycine max]